MNCAALVTIRFLSTAAQAPVVPTIDVHSPYRLVPLGRTQRDTTRWRVERRVVHDAGGTWGLQVMVVSRGGRTTPDSVGFDVGTLALVWEHSGGPVSTAVAVSGARLEGTLDSGGIRRRFVAQAPDRVYSSTMDDAVIQRLPLAPGYRRLLEFWNGSGLERDTVQVRDSGPDGWTVDFREPYAVETLWIDRRSRLTTRHLYRWRRDGTESEVMTGPSEQDSVAGVRRGPRS